MEIHERSSLMYWPFKPTLDSSSSLDDNFFKGVYCCSQIPSSLSTIMDVREDFKEVIF